MAARQVPSRHRGKPATVSLSQNRVRYCGALLQNPSLTQDIFRTLVNSVKRPISLKMRIGVNESNKLLFQDIAKIAEREGIQMVTLHPRTVSQGYSGHSDWDMIKKLKQIMSIPVVGNGDITSPEIAKKMLD